MQDRARAKGDNTTCVRKGSSKALDTSKNWMFILKLFASPEAGLHAFQAAVWWHASPARLPCSHAKVHWARRVLSAKHFEDCAHVLLTVAASVAGALPMDAMPSPAAAAAGKLAPLPRSARPQVLSAVSYTGSVKQPASAAQTTGLGCAAVSCYPLVVQALRDHLRADTMCAYYSLV